MIKDDINLQDQILNTKQNLGKKKKELTFTISADTDLKKANILLKELEEEVEAVDEKLVYVSPLHKTPKVKKEALNKALPKNLVVSISTPVEVRVLEAEFKRLLEEIGSSVKFNRSQIYKIGLEVELAKVKRDQQLIKMYEESLKNV